MMLSAAFEALHAHSSTHNTCMLQRQHLYVHCVFDAPLGRRQLLANNCCMGLSALRSWLHHFPPIAAVLHLPRVPHSLTCRHNRQASCC